MAESRGFFRRLSDNPRLVRSQRSQQRQTSAPVTGDSHSHAVIAIRGKKAKRVHIELPFSSDCSANARIRVGCEFLEYL